MRFGNGTLATPSDYKFIKGGVPKEVAQLWTTEMPRDERRRRELRLLEERYARCSTAYWSRVSERRADAVRDELQEAARLTPNGFMAAAFRILRRTRPSACGNKARAAAPDLMCAIFEDGNRARTWRSSRTLRRARPRHRRPGTYVHQVDGPVVLCVGAG